MWYMAGRLPFQVHSKPTIMKNKNTSFFISLLLVLFAILNFLIFQFNYQKETSKQYKNQVINVIDGDTIVINSGVLVRLHGLNAPDLKYCGGKEAKQKLENLVLNKKVSLGQIAKGEHDRILALVYVNNILVNEVLLKNGHGELFGAQTKAKEKLQAANQYARKNKLGIYGKCILRQPPSPECNIKGNIHARRKTKIYHLPECPNYKATKVETFRGENWFCSQEEAEKAGFTMAKNCP